MSQYQPLNQPSNNPNNQPQGKIGIKGGCSIIFFAFLGYLTYEKLYDYYFEPEKKQEQFIPEQSCKNKAGQPYESACRLALRYNNLDVTKYVKWSGADNGYNAAVCIGEDKYGTLYSFDVVWNGVNCSQSIVVQSQY